MTKSAVEQQRANEPRGFSKDNLPELKHEILLTEQSGRICLDITDETGGLGLKLFLQPVIAQRFGEAMAEKARLMVSLGEDDPKRKTERTFGAAAAKAAEAVAAAALSDGEK